MKLYQNSYLDSCYADEVRELHHLVIALEFMERRYQALREEE